MRILLSLAAILGLFALATPMVLAQRTASGAVIDRSEHSYGADPRQRLILWIAPQKRPAPIIVYLHGGGWSAGDPMAGGGSQPGHFLDLGFAYAAVSYRFVPQARVEDQLADVARAVRWLRGRAKQIGGDPDRIVLIGHSSGGHLAAMIGSDPQWLRAARVPFGAIRAVVLLDGAGFDVPTLMAPYPGTTMGYYGAAFGADPARRLRLSPTAHLSPPNAPAWLFLQDASRFEAYAEAEKLADPLRAAGARAVVKPVLDTNHMRLNNAIGTPGDDATAQIDAFLADAIK